MTHIAHIAYVALGSNLEAPIKQVRAGFAALNALPHTKLIAQSPLYRSAPIGLQGEKLEQPEYINAAAKIETQLAPRALLEALLNIEKHQGRTRSFLHAPRTLDLDLLLYDDVQHHEHGLTIPHPQLHERAFVLLPLTDIAPQEFVIPGQGALQALLTRVDASSVERLEMRAA